MNETIIAALLGCLGGTTRASTGLLKALAVKRKINWKYWAITVTISTIIGAFTGIIFDFDYRLSLLSGYAGTDLLEGIYKSFKIDKIYVMNRK